jgi:hypothetical protein
VLIVRAGDVEIIRASRPNKPDALAPFARIFARQQNRTKCRIRNVVMPAWRMIDDIATAASCSTF